MYILPRRIILDGGRIRYQLASFMEASAQAYAPTQAYASTQAYAAAVYLWTESELPDSFYCEFRLHTVYMRHRGMFISAKTCIPSNKHIN